MIMTNISQEVWNYLARDPSIQKNLKRGLLNIRALAKHIIKERYLNASIDAVISAIRRFSNNEEFLEETATIEEIFKDSVIATKNNIACIILRNNSDILKYLSEVMKITDFEKRETLRLVKAKNNLKIMTDMKNLDKFKKFFSNKELEIKKNLSEIRIKTSLRADQTRGVAARVSNEMLLRNINISEIIFCVPEIIIYVNQKDLLSAHESIMQLCQGE